MVSSWKLQGKSSGGSQLCADSFFSPLPNLCPLLYLILPTLEPLLLDLSRVYIFCPPWEWEGITWRLTSSHTDLQPIPLFPAPHFPQYLAPLIPEPLFSFCVSVFVLFFLICFLSVSISHCFSFFLAALGLLCCTRAFSSCGELGLLSSSRCTSFSFAAASLVAEHRL